MNVDVEKIAPPVAFAILGTILLVIGAGGVVPIGDPQPILEPSLKTGLVWIGTSLILIGPALFVWQSVKEVNKAKQVFVDKEGLKEEAQNSGIKIVYPGVGDNEIDGSSFIAFGKCKNRPVHSRMELFVVSPRGVGYWPQDVASFDNNADNTWRAKVSVGGAGGGKSTVIAALVGTSGQALTDYYRKVGHETDHWPSIERLTPDIIEVDRVEIIRR